MKRTAMTRNRMRAKAIMLLGLIGLIAPLQAVRMGLIAAFPEQIDGTFACGDANHDGRDEVMGSISEDSIVAYEYQGNSNFQRISVYSRAGCCEFGDGDNDSLMELVGTSDHGAIIWESRTRSSFPSESVWSADPDPTEPGPTWPRFMDIFGDGHQELGLLVEGHGLYLYENTGDNAYSLAAVLSDTPPFGGISSDFDACDLDRDGYMELVTGSFWYWLTVYKATGRDHEFALIRCSTETSRNINMAVAHHMDQDRKPKFIAVGTWVSGGNEYQKLMIYEATANGQYERIWEQARSDFYPAYGNPISVGDVDGDGAEEFAVNGGGFVTLYRCTGLHTYSEVWQRDSTGTCQRLYDINHDGRAEIIFDGPRGTEIWEDTEGLGVVEFSKFPLESQVMATPSVARLGASLQLSGVPPDAEVEILGLDGRLVIRTQEVRQSNWTWNLRNQAGNLVPAGTYFAVIRSKGKTTSLKLCLVK